MTRLSHAKQRHFAQSHSRAAHAENRGYEIHRRSDAADAGNQQRQRPEIGAVPGRECARSKRRIGKPADVRRVAGAVQPIAADEAEIEQQASERGHPETEGVQPRKGHIARANHQRNQIGAEAKEDGHGHEENHGGAVHREHAVENFRRNKMIVRNDELDPHDGRFDAADHEEDQRVDDVENAQLLVVHGDNPIVEPFTDWPCVTADCAERDGF